MEEFSKLEDANSKTSKRNAATSLHIIIYIKDNLDDQVPPNKKIKSQRM